MTPGKNRYIYSGLAVFSFIILFVISPDSYTHDAYNRVDSAWFFMCGKAWMNGLTPYVDFSDSKGPLLWLIYGVGYLFSHCDYHGVFWVSWLWYAAIYIYTYKTALIFLHSPLKSVLCSVIMTLSFFNSWFHYETRAEDFCLLFLMMSLYTTTSTIYQEWSEKQTRRAFFCLGLCFAALIFIKFNIAAMQTIFPLYLLCFCFRHHTTIVKPALYGVLGVLTIAIPFITYFLIAGNGEAFVQEYFFNTMQTVSNGNIVTEYVKEWLAVINNPATLTLLAVIITGSLLMAKHLKQEPYYPLVTSLFVFSLTVRHALWPYYYTTCSFAVIWLITYYLSGNHFILTVRKTAAISALAVLFCFVSNIFSDSVFRPIFFRQYPEKEHFYKVSAIMSQTDKPTLINACCWEYGYGLKANALPGGKYWTLQNGASPAMIKEHREEILSGKSRFLFVYHSDLLKLANLSLPKLQSAGYHICYEWGSDNNRRYLLRRLSTD